MLGLGAVAAAAASFPFLPPAIAALACVLVGALVVGADAADAALRAGHARAVFAERGLVRRWTGGGALRVLAFGAFGTVLAALLLVRLAAGGPAVWAACAAAVPVTWAALAVLAPRLVREGAGPHGARLARALARVIGVAAVLAGAALAGLAGALPDPGAAPPAASALLAEGFAAHRLWAGLEAAALGRAAELGALTRGQAAALALVLQAGAAWAAASLALTLALPRGAWARAIGPASDAPAPPPPRPTAIVAAGAVALAAVSAALWTEARLAAVNPADRPVGQVQVAAERIGAVLYRPGTIAAVGTLRRATAEADAAAAAALRRALEAGFDGMLANVDPFLDGHYSLTGEYRRLGAWAAGDLAGHLERRLAAALAAGDPMAAARAAQGALDRAAVAAAERAAAEAVVMDANRLGPVNPGLLRIEAARPALPPPALPAGGGMATTEGQRAALGLVVGAVAGAAALRIARRLALRGAIGVAAKGLGAAFAVGADYAAVKLEEALHRDAFRAEIVAAIEAARAEALAALP